MAGQPLTAAADPATAMHGGPNTLELWVPADQVDLVMGTVKNDLALALGGALQVDAYRTDPQGAEETIAMLRSPAGAPAQSSSSWAGWGC